MKTWNLTRIGLSLAGLLISGTALTARAQDDQSARRDPHGTLRRLTLDLAGREPTKEEIKDFDADNSPKAYRKLVDRLVSEKSEDSARKDTDRAKDLLDAATLDRMTEDYNSLILLSLTKAQQGQSTYMGVGVEAPGEALRAQLKLPEGLGLVVNFVDPNGPSKDLIHQHDVLEKLDDQLLMNGEQFASLVHMHKQGESVVVTVIREAKPTQITIKLGQKEVSSDAKELERVDPHAAFGQAANYWKWALTPDKDGNIFALQRSGPVTFDDGSTVAVFQQTHDQQYLTAFDRAAGKLLFTGPIGSDAQWNEVPPEVRNRVSAWRAIAATPGDKSQQMGMGIWTQLPHASDPQRAPQTQPAAEKK